MKKEYLISYQESGKQIITYFGGECDGLIEHYANKDGVVVGEIRSGYTKHKDSL